MLEPHEDDEAAPARPVPRRLSAILARGMATRSGGALPVDARALRRARARGGAAALAVGGGGRRRGDRRQRGNDAPGRSLSAAVAGGRLGRVAEGGGARAAGRARSDQRRVASGGGDGARGSLRRRAVGDDVASCRATRVEGAQSDTLFDLRARCLDRRRDELAAATGLVIGARDRREIDRAVGALAELTPVASCGDANGLAQLAPDKPRDRKLADEILRESADIETERRAGRLDGLLPRAQALVARAETLGNAATLSSALLALADVQLEGGEKAAGRATLERLTQIAAEAHDDTAEAMAWARLVGLIGDDEGMPREALALVPAARAAVLRAGNVPRQRVDLLVQRSHRARWQRQRARGAEAARRGARNPRRRGRRSRRVAAHAAPGRRGDGACQCARRQRGHAGPERGRLPASHSALSARLRPRPSR